MVQITFQKTDNATSPTPFRSNTSQNINYLSHRGEHPDGSGRAVTFRKQNGNSTTLKDLFRSEFTAVHPSPFLTTAN